MAKTNFIEINYTNDSVDIQYPTPLSFAPELVNKTIAQTLAALPNTVKVFPAAHLAAYQLAFEAAHNDLRTESLSVLVRVEAVLETIQFFSVQLRDTLGLNAASKKIATQHEKLKKRLRDVLNAKHDSTLANDTIVFATLWLEEEKELFRALSTRLRELPALKIRRDHILRLEEIDNPALLKLLAQTLEDCPQFAAEPHFGPARITGAIARRNPSASSYVQFADLFSAHIAEISALCQGKSSTLGRVLSRTVAPHQAISLVETALGLLIAYVRVENGHIQNALFISPSHWVLQPNGALSGLLKEDLRFNKGDIELSMNDAPYICAAFGLPRNLIQLKTTAFGIM